MDGLKCNTSVVLLSVGVCRLDRREDFTRLYQHSASELDIAVVEAGFPDVGQCDLPYSWRVSS